jgi:centromere/kinetochore protein ZW10
VQLIRTVAQTWEPILSKSAWTQAIGSLLSTLCQKIIMDVSDLSSLGSDLSFHIASLITKIVKLDDLFTPKDISSNGAGEAHQPVTSQYVPQWLKLQFLSEVLQSELKDVTYLWFESDLSLYFTAQEVIDLIEMSFEHNARTRHAISEIKNSPTPRGVVAA